tara:strand:- start:580 stop:1680 length:1101 start_codon:yes stop_codon:yes gene_type:complete
MTAITFKARKITAASMIFKEDLSAELTIPNTGDISYTGYEFVGVDASLVTYYATTKIHEAIGRIGKQIERETVTLEQSDSVDEFGTNIGRIVLYGGTSLEDFDARREGKDIKLMKHFDKRVSPMIKTYNASSFMKDDVIDHEFAFTEYGQDKSFEYTDDNYFNIPFFDNGVLNPKDIVGNSYGYGGLMIDESSTNNVFYTEPTKYKTNGVIDILETRKELSRIDIFRSELASSKKGIKTGISSTDYNEIVNGNAVMTDEIEYASLKLSQAVFFEDSNASNLGVMPTNSLASNTLINFPFKDITYFHEKDSRYDILNNSTIKSQFLSGSDKTKSKIGESFKTSNRGLIFDNRNGLGTDSISFGGFLK